MKLSEIKAIAERVLNLARARITEAADYIEGCAVIDADDVAFPLLGGGHFGKAWRLPDGRVLKISRVIDGTCFWIHEAARHYLTHGKAKEFMPEVYAYGVYADGWWCVLEHVHTRFKWTQADMDVYGYLLDDTRMEVRSYWGNTDVRLENACPAAYSAVQAFEQDKRLIDDDDYSSMDVHNENWGVAKTTTGYRVVVFDPIADGEYDKSKLKALLPRTKLPSIVKRMNPAAMMRGGWWNKRAVLAA